jgi:hypothetical protein
MQRQNQLLESLTYKKLEIERHNRQAPYPYRYTDYSGKVMERGRASEVNMDSRQCGIHK